MQKILGIFLLEMLRCLVICDDVFADHNIIKGEKIGIYFCSTDLGGFSASKGQPSDKSLKGLSVSSIIVDIGDSYRHKHLRHCFLMLANELTLNKAVSGKIALYVLASFGYYYNSYLDRGEINSEDWWLFNKDERKKYVVSCTPIVQKGMLGIKKDNFQSELTEADVNNIWTKEVYFNLVEYASKNPKYNRDSNNCCTAAFESLRKARDESVNFSLDLKNIKKRNFNILGRGIVLDWKDDTYVDYVRGTGKSIADTLLSIPKFIGAKIKEKINYETVDEDDFLSFSSASKTCEEKLEEEKVGREMVNEWL